MSIKSCLLHANSYALTRAEFQTALQIIIKVKKLFFIVSMLSKSNNTGHVRLVIGQIVCNDGIH